MSVSARKIVIGNWKMNGSLAQNAALLTELNGLLSSAAQNAKVQVAVCAPFPYLAQVQGLLIGSTLQWGAQDLSVQDAGAYTGEVSAPMLTDFGCTYVLVGHSERRAIHAESDQLVADKAAQALKHQLVPVVCVGETLAERESDQVYATIARQLAPVLALGEQAVSQMVFAYEPVWAIGTGKTASPEQAQQVHAQMRKALGATVTILYGGSVKADNAQSLFAMQDIDGGLIGGAALNAQDFMRIVNACANVAE